MANSPDLHDEAVRRRLLVSAGALSRELQSAAPPVVLDARSPARYGRGHIPGARPFPLAEIVQLRDGVQSLAEPAVFAARAGVAGLTRETPIVIVGERGCKEAAYVFWAFAYHGHTAVRVLDGGIEAWSSQGGELTTAEPAAFNPAVYLPDVRADLRADADQIRRRLGESGLVLLDTRDPDEFDGTDDAPGRGGHIPGAVRIDWEADLDETGLYHAASALRHHFAGKGIGAESECILYCYGGPRAAHVYLALKLAGYDRLRLYERSWADWSARLDLPIATQSEQDEGALGAG
ncbi:MAG TPA: sulfurtransferase [Limnochordia bacterium]|nr:sulfurtransferase [Limnochordia bacterium]